MKIKKILYFLGLLIMITSCNSTKGEFQSQSKEISLMGNPTTGYTWTYEIEDESIIEIKEFEKYLGDNGIVGAPSQFTYVITSKKAGKTAIKFSYSRSWENNPPAKIEEYRVIVNNSGTIEIKK